MRLALAATLLTLVLPGAAGALAPLVRISGTSPLARSCEGRSVQRGSEVEPTLAVDPRDANVMAAAWQQDRYRVGGGAAALGVAYSRDGGATWTAATVPGVTDCLVSSDRNSDPWLSFGPDGTLYLASIPGTISKKNGLKTRVIVNVSRDGGATWSQPTELATRGGPFNDKPSVTADPTRPGYAYEVWSQLDRILLSRTTDGGATWSPARTIARGQVLNVSTIAVLPDGTLLHTYFTSGRTSERIVASRSTDAGLTWSKPVRVGAVDRATPLAPRTGLAARTEPLAAPSAVAAPDGRVYAAWSTAAFGKPLHVVVARSLDGGRTWSRAKAAIGGSNDSFSPALAVSRTGTVAVSAYRFRSGDRADAVAALSSNGARSWRLVSLTRPFSLRKAPQAQAGDRFLGDYTGLAATPTGFAAGIAAAPPLAAHGRSDVFLARIAAR